tara:strand:+ start:140 stop:1774 length:1635 start_codon:yes stop_codon:yes gene_type:complete
MSSINKIIANVQRTSTNLEVANFYNDQRLVTIDSSNNRIGINTLHPKHAIDISYRPLLDISDLTINTPYLLVNQHANFSKDISCNNADISNLTVNRLITKIINLNNIDVNSVISATSSLSSIDSSNINNQQSITTDSLICNQSNFNSINIPENGTLICNGNMQTKNIEISNGGSFSCHENVNFVINGNLKYGSLTPTSETTLTSFPSIDVSNLDASFINVRQELSANIINCNNLNTTNFQFDGDLLISNLTIKNTIRSNQTDTFDIQGIDTLNSNNIITSQLNCTNNSILSNVNINNKLDCSSTNLGIILPDIHKLDNNFINLNKQQNQLYFDNSIDTFRIYSNITEKHELCLTRQRWCKLGLDSTAYGNQRSDTGNTIIDASNLIIQSNNDSKYYKIIPFIIDLSSNYQDFSIDTSIYITNISGESVNYLTINDTDRIYQIDANICIQYLNKFPGDVEVTHYEFIVYNEFDFDFNGHIHPQYSIKNQIFSIDTSYNYASSSFNLIIDSTAPKNKINFLLASTSLENLEQLRIESFNSSIKCIG